MFSIRIRKRKYSLGDVYKKYFRGIFKAVLADLLFLKLLPVKKRPLIILVGHRLNGNLRAFYDFLSSEQSVFDVEFFTDDPEFYKKTKRMNRKRRIYSLQKLSHLRLAASARVVCTSHGSSFLTFWKNSKRRPLFIELWHGAGFKNRTAGQVRGQLFYDGVFVSSPTFKKFHKDWGYSDKQLFVTGYGQVDSLVSLPSKKEQSAIKQKFNINPNDNGKLILLAPTWNSHNNEELMFFGQPAENILKRLGKFAEKNNAHLLVLPHLNSNTKLVQNRNVRIISGSGELDIKPLLHVIDVLITDWSSIYTDFLALAKPKPVVFLDIKPTFYGFTLTPEDRAGELASSIDELEKYLASALENQDKYLAKFSKKMKAATNRVWGETLDSKSSQRYYETIKKLLHEKSR